MSSPLRAPARGTVLAATGIAALSATIVPAVALGETADNSQNTATAEANGASAMRHHHHRSWSSRPMRRARLTRLGHAVAPENAPWQVRRVIAAANRIASRPYVWGGGHGSWYSYGYDCSGSVSYALHGARLLRRPSTSSALMGYGRPGRGRWITIYASGGHTYMVVAGLRFDTAARKWSRSRWTRHSRGHWGFVARHPRGL
jgi:cell wall-associated NlpC family hydrolase